MGYYRGDYYGGRTRGDYYRGDFASILGAVGNLLPQSWTPAGAQKVGFGTAAAALTGAAAAFAPGLAAAAGRFIGAGSATTQTMPPQMPRMGAPIASGGSAPGQVVQLPSGQLARVGRRYRRMNPGNIKAARRSLRRIRSVGKLMSTIKRDVSKAATSLGVHRSVRLARGKR